MSPNPECNYTDTRSSQANQASRTPDFSYSLVSCTSFPSSSPFSLFLVHNSIIIPEHTIKSSLSISWWLWVDTKYMYTPSISIHRVQHPPSTPATHDCVSSLHSHHSELTAEYSVTFWRTSLHDRPPSASSPWELKCKVTLSHSRGCDLTNWWIESQHRCGPSTASKYLSNLDHGLQVYIQSCWITASKCISNLTRSQPWSESPDSLDYSLQVSTIMAPKCIFQLIRIWLPSVSPNTLDNGLQVRMIIGSRCISKLARLWPASLHNYFLQVHLPTQLSFSGSPRIALKHRLQPVQIYTMCRWVAIWIHRWEYKLNTWVLKIVEQ